MGIGSRSTGRIEQILSPVKSSRGLEKFYRLRVIADTTMQ